MISSRKYGLWANEHIRIYRGEMIQLSGRIAAAARTDTKTSARPFIERAAQKARFSILTFNCSLYPPEADNRVGRPPNSCPGDRKEGAGFRSEIPLYATIRIGQPFGIR